jgi:hypothetical protein
LGSVGKPAGNTNPDTKEQPMKALSLTAALLATLFGAGAAAQPMPPPPGAPGVPPAEVLATVPGLTSAQQAELRKILVQRRDSQEAAQARMRTEFDALRVKERNERERIDEQSSEQLRKVLGDEGYRKYAEWDLAHRGPPGGERGPRPGMGPRGGRGNGPDNGAPPQRDTGAAAHGGTAPEDSEQ